GSTATTLIDEVPTSIPRNVGWVIVARLYQAPHIHSTPAAFTDQHSTTNNTVIARRSSDVAINTPTQRNSRLNTELHN
ncbi:MAG: hypothetical protein ACKVKV_05390, partial [Dehalococcoidia bacterium]